MHRNRTVFLFYFLFFASLFTFVTIASLKNNSKVNDDLNSSVKISGWAGNKKGNLVDLANENAWIVQGNVTSFNIQTGVASIHFLIIPMPGMNNRTSTLQVISNSKVTNFSNLDVVPQIDVSINVFEGSKNLYPFDRYTLNGFIQLMEGGKTVSIYLMSLSTANDFWKGDAALSIDPNPPLSNTVYIQIVYSRSNMIIIFSLLIGLFMWLLAISIFLLSTLIWIRGRKVEPPTIGIACALLFALPSVRNNLPGNPHVGVTFDIASYFFCLLLVGISVLLLIWNYIHSNSNQGQGKVAMSDRGANIVEPKSSSRVKVVEKDKFY